MEEPIETENLSRFAVAIALAVVIVGAVLVPIISTVMDPGEVHTYTNIGDPYRTTDSRSHTISITQVGDEYKISSDGEEIKILEVMDEGVDENTAIPFIISFGDDNAIIFRSNGYIYDHRIDTHYQSAHVSVGHPITVTVTNVASYVDGDGMTRTASVTLFAGKGQFEYAMSKDSAGDVYLLEDTEFMGVRYMGAMTRGNLPVRIGYIWSGTINDHDVTILDPVGRDMGETTAVLDIDEGEECYTNPFVTYVTEWGDYGESEIYESSFFVPKTIRYVIPGDSIGMAKVLLGVIPIIVVLGILMAIVTYLNPDLRSRFIKGGN